MIQTINDIARDPLTLAWLGVLAGLFGWQVVAGKLQYDEALGAISKVLKGLNAVEFKHVTSEADLEKVKECFKKAPESLAHPWREYKEALTTIELSGGRKIRNTVQADRFFSLKEVVGNWMDPTVGPTLMSLGILGTFVGLTVGLSSFHMGTTDELRKSVEGLIGGMQTAFVTSIAGITLAVAYGAVRRRWTRFLQIEFNHLITKIDGLFIRQTSHELQMELLKQNQRQNATLETLSQDLANHMETSLQKTLVPVLEGMSETLGVFRGDATKNQMDALDDIVHGFTDKISGTFDSQFGLLAEKLEEAVSGAVKFGESLETSHRSLAELAATQERVESQFTQHLQAVSEMMARTKDMLAELQDLGSNIGAAGEQFSAASEQLEVQTEALAEITGNFERTADSIRETSETFDSVWMQHRETVAELAETTDESLRTFATQTSESLQTSLGQFDNALSESVSTLGQGIAGLADLLSDLEGFLDSARQTIETAQQSADSDEQDIEDEEWEEEEEPEDDD